MREGLMARRLAGTGTLGLILGLLLLVSGSAGANHPPQVCPSSGQGHPGWTKVDRSSGAISGDWGSVTWSVNSIAWDVNGGWTVEVCVKTGGSQGLSVDTFTVTGPNSGGKTYRYEISHVSVKVTAAGAIEETTSTTTAEKATETTEAEDTTREAEDTTTTTVAAEVLPTVVTTSTTGATVVTVAAGQVTTAFAPPETLPFTGRARAASLVGLGAASLALGTMALAVARRRERSAD